MTFEASLIASYRGALSGKVYPACQTGRLGEGELRVNGQPMWEYFKRAPRKARGFLRRLMALDEVAELLVNMEVVISSSVSSMRKEYSR